MSPDVVLVSAYIDMHTDEVVRRLRAARPELHIITGSLSNNPQFISGTLDAGADDYICLPLFEDDLLRTIQRFRDRIGPTLKAYIEQQRQEQAESKPPDSPEL